MAHFKCNGPKCAQTNAGTLPTCGPVGINDSGDPGNPIDRVETRLPIGLSDSFAIITPVKAAKIKIDPLANPTPLEEIGVSERNKLFQIADTCRKKSKNKLLVPALDDTGALKKACEKVVVGNNKVQNFLEAYVKRMEEGSKKQISQTKDRKTKLELQKSTNKLARRLRTNVAKKNHIAFADTDTMTVLFTGDFLKAAKANGKFSNGRTVFSSALAFFRLVYLHEQCHLYLRLRGIHEDWMPSGTGSIPNNDPKKLKDVDTKKELDKLFATIGKSKTALSSCHHQAIPHVEVHYNKYNKKVGSKYGYLKNYTRGDHI